ncbi:MAG TPA: aminoacyl-tRNA hydrolase [Hyphomicrobiaceae bacterium]|nr:aminoacyl-tRNA hydrolase [Hyphomicrobiaceae bacterium]
MKLFVGIGNPGAKYARHRHNVGFMAVERIAERHGFGPWRRRFQGHTADGELDGTKVLLLKPDTYMNESGRAVGEAARFLKLSTSDIVVFHDELDLLPGKLKVKTGGGNAGHNGLRSITAHLDNEYARVRIGIGHPGAKELVQSWVLHDFARADEAWLEPLLDAIADAAPRLAADDTPRFLTDVARALTQDGDGQEAPKQRRGAVAEASPARSAERHPTGERAGKRATALAENLKNWLAKRRPKD